MFLEAGHTLERLAPMTEHFRPWLAAQFEANSYFGRIALKDDAVVGSVGWMTLDWPPHPLHPQQGKRGYVLNLFVEPDHRGKGIAKALMADADAWFLGAGIEYCILHSTRIARTMYEKLGWNGTSEMARKYLQQQ
jgi:GNAT superfamily N-acetyltransferase